MLGPALTRLFQELDRRRDQLTTYEEDLHRELLAAGPAPGGGSLSGGRRGLTRRGEAQRDLDISADDEPSGTHRKRRRRAGLIVGGRSDYQVDLSSDSDFPQLQIGCTKVDCPNKRRR